jgi:hypothetical protein
MASLALLAQAKAGRRGALTPPMQFVDTSQNHTGQRKSRANLLTVPLFCFRRRSRVPIIEHQHDNAQDRSGDGIMGLQTRRDFLRHMAAGMAGAACSRLIPSSWGQVPGDRPKQDASVQVLHPQGRIPVSLIIDDSTCLVNLNRFAIPQFDEAWGGKRKEYRVDWRKMPAEIPDAFVRKFGEWCAEHGVKGKYSIIPYPACVGRVDRILPGWTQRQLDDSLKLVRTLMVPHWDIHPEMVTHTWAINTRTGHPYAERSLRYQENWDWSAGKSVDELAGYMAYALRILRNVGLSCEGLTTPGGFGTRVLPQLAQATLQSCRDVFKAEIPHYFRHGFSRGTQSVAPRVEYASALGSEDPRCVVSVVACTGDWTGGWDCSNRGDVDKFITPDLKGGRVVEVIARGEPAVLMCHWTGIYFNGEEVGFKIFQEVVRRLHARYDNLVWMKVGEIARYWAARTLTDIARQGSEITLSAPYACPRFTVQASGKGAGVPRLSAADRPVTLVEVSKPLQLKPGTWLRDPKGVTICFDLPRGKSVLRV